MALVAFIDGPYDGIVTRADDLDAAVAAIERLPRAGEDGRYVVVPVAGSSYRQPSLEARWTTMPDSAC